MPNLWNILKCQSIRVLPLVPLHRNPHHSSAVVPLKWCNSTVRIENMRCSCSCQYLTAKRGTQDCISSSFSSPLQNVPRQAGRQAGQEHSSHTATDHRPCGWSGCTMYENEQMNDEPSLRPTPSVRRTATLNIFARHSGKYHREFRTGAAF